MPEVEDAEDERRRVEEGRGAPRSARAVRSRRRRPAIATYLANSLQRTECWPENSLTVKGMGCIPKTVTPPKTDIIVLYRTSHSLKSIN